MIHVDEESWLEGKINNNAHLTPEVSDEQKEAILSFLGSGTPVISFFGLKPDAINLNLISGSGDFITDGTWIWKDTLTYYIRTYSFMPPEYFYTHMQSKSYIAETVDTDRILEVENFIRLTS